MASRRALFPRQGGFVSVAFSGCIGAQCLEIEQCVFRQQGGSSIVSPLPVAHIEQHAGFQGLYCVERESVVEGCFLLFLHGHQLLGLPDVIENLLVDGRDVRRAVFLFDVGVGREDDAAVRRRRGGIVGLAVDVHQLEVDIGADGIGFAEDLFLGLAGGVVVGIRCAVYYGVGIEDTAVTLPVGEFLHLAVVLPGVVVRECHGIAGFIEFAGVEPADLVGQQARIEPDVVQCIVVVPVREQGAELRYLVRNYLADGFDLQIVARGESHCGEQYVYCFFHVRNVLECDIETDRVGAGHRLRIDASVGSPDRSIRRSSRR